MNEWFTDWFNSPYYHLLYSYRNQEEADQFIKQLVSKLNITKGNSVTDVGCGSGRHCRALFQSGMKVTGIDLSENSIKKAREISPADIHYFVHDMRQPLPVINQDVALNLFTSFGYFNNDESIQVLRNIHAALKSNGMLLLDYLNAVPLYNLPNETMQTPCNNIKFTISRYADQTHVYKTIVVNDNNREFTHTEKVALYGLPQLSDFLNQTGFQIINTFGDYMFNAYQPHSSPRLMLQAIKK